MKPSITVLLSAVFYVFFPALNDAPENAALYGEWKNADQQSPVRTIKFFRNHLVNVAAGNDVEVGTYTVLKRTGTPETELSGEISEVHLQQFLFSNAKSSSAGDIRFKAEFSNTASMKLELNKGADLKIMVLKKTRELLPGTILINE